jgi:hypothetical protein
MNEDESGGFAFPQVTQPIVNIGGGWNLFTITSKNANTLTDKGQTTGIVQSKHKNTMEVFPIEATGFQISDNHLIFAQSYVLTGADGEIHLIMYWFDSLAGKDQLMYGYLDNMLGAGNNDMKTPQWARYQYQQLREYLTKQGIGIS